MSEMRLCIVCQKSLPEKYQTQTKFCSSRCRRIRYAQRYGVNSAHPGLAPGTVGAMNELRVCVDLLALGYDVFRAMSPSCSCDLAILREGQLLRVEVRTGYENRTTKTLVTSKGTPSKFDVFAIVLPDRIVYLPENVIRISPTP